MFDIHQRVFDEDGERDEDRFEDYVSDLMSEFEGSPEAQPVLEEYGEIGWSQTMMDLSINYLGSTPAEMTVSEFEEVLFDLIPRKVTTDPENAGEIIAELRAFWKFIARQYGLINAQQIHDSLDESSELDLLQELADPANFGLAKSFFTLGQQSGFDMTSQAGIEGFQDIYNRIMSSAPPPRGRPLDPKFINVIPPLGFPSTRPYVGEVLKKKRNEKKRQRAAKKKNRR